MCNTSMQHPDGYYHFCPLLSPYRFLVILGGHRGGDLDLLSIKHHRTLPHDTTLTDSARRLLIKFLTMLLPRMAQEALIKADV